MAEPIDYSVSLKIITDSIEFKNSPEYLNSQELEKTNFQNQLNTINESLLTINNTLTPSSEKAALPDAQFNTLLLAVQDTNSYLSNIQNFNVSLTVGLGLLIGIISTVIFSLYLKH